MKYYNFHKFPIFKITIYSDYINSHDSFYLLFSRIILSILSLSLSQRIQIQREKENR